MLIEFDTDKRDKTMAERGLDFARAGEGSIISMRNANEREIEKYAPDVE